ncbi:hypothetical protein [Eubacterium oxidoreducens]|uniref:Fibronectin type-III domain-containing protein n=1 Tax=Eubacterium oxidoreducens TaxID=1732 RepID=A0A1G6BP22_EUBOX|nr:hypothetical protein [Eubacterium oxidoreducens]SDB22308.1 hypothetical protein SAMN02910417_01680 [Eubacterium oxidoreducens]
MMKKAMLSIALTGALIISIGHAGSCYAADRQNVNLAISGANNPTKGPSESDASEYSSHFWKGNYIYFGQGQLWSLLDNDEESLLILADVLKEDGEALYQTFDSSTNVWTDSSLKQYLNGSSYLANTNQFTSLEKSLITKEVTIPTMAQLVNRAYGFSEEYAPDGTRTASAPYWVQDQHSTDGYAIFVCQFGSVFTGGTSIADPTVGVRPMVTLDTSKVLYSVAGQYAKSTFGTVASNLVVYNTWKLTLKDGNRDFKAQTTSSSVVAGNQISVKVTNLGSVTSYNHISAMLFDKDKDLVAYGFAGKSTAAKGTYTFTIPSNTEVGTYTLCVFAESAKQTSASVVTSDTASNTCDFKIQVTPAKAVIKSYKAKKKKVKLTLKKIAGVSGYQIRYSYKKNMKKSKTVTTSKVTKTIKNLKSNKTVYIKVRAYKKDALGNRVYGAWSKKIKVKVK